MRIALVHDYLLYFGGAERVLKAFHELYPDAPIFTVLCDWRVAAEYFPGATIRASFLQKAARVFPHRSLLPLIPLAVESFNFSDYDVIISSSSAFAKGIITPQGAVHVCYCHTPPRFLWEDAHRYLRESRLPQPFRVFTQPLLHWLRIWDMHAAMRPDYFVANSRYTAERIRKYYHREAEVIYPPIGIQNPEPGISNERERQIPNSKFHIPDSYFLMVGRLAPHKRFDVAVQTFARFRYPLVIAGDGPDRPRLERAAGGARNITFLGTVSDGALRALYERSRALIHPSVEDFGLAMAEALHYVKPVLAYRAGGALEIVREGETGEFFDEQTPESLGDGVRRILEGIEEHRYGAYGIRTCAERFSRERFSMEFRALLEHAIKERSI